jgi:hypothetical protein
MTRVALSYIYSEVHRPPSGRPKDFPLSSVALLRGHTYETAMADQRSIRDRVCGGMDHNRYVGPILLST